MIQETQQIIFRVKKGEEKESLQNIDHISTDNISEENLNHKYTMGTLETVNFSDVKDVQDSFPWPHRTVTPRRNMQ